MNIKCMNWLFKIQNYFSKFDLYEYFCYITVQDISLEYQIKYSEYIHIHIEKII